ncbi:uncharacterized protein LOC142741757 [Rhinoderma darwinii]|uniref:uncharacterized protein LOC142741757 n=1 Tax=Rhinoderma darwinii TaxID=43563 RepID=UPI003F67EC8E
MSGKNLNNEGRFNDVLFNISLTPDKRILTEHQILSFTQQNGTGDQSQIRGQTETISPSEDLVYEQFAVPCEVRLTDYNKQEVEIMGSCFVIVYYGKDRGNLRIIINKGHRASLLDWFEPLGIQLTEIHHVKMDYLQDVIRDFSVVFEEGLGKFTGPPISFKLDPNTADFAVPAMSEILMLESLYNPPLQSTDIARMTAMDPILARVLNWHELSAYKGCLIWGNRAVIPTASQTQVLKSLQKGHPGIGNMKALARSYVWWPKIDEHTEKWVKKCTPYQTTRHSPTKAVSRSWEVTRNLWSRLHIVFAGPVQGQTFFLVVDSFSKWLEAVPVSSATTSTVIQVLRRLFATHGLPDTIVSDNGLQLTCTELKWFMENNPIHHVTTAPFHPSVNEQAEHMVQTTKDALKRLRQ